MESGTFSVWLVRLNIAVGGLRSFPTQMSCVARRRCCSPVLERLVVVCNFLQKNGLDLALREVASLGGHILGVCLGMQFLFEQSSEFGRHLGLGLITGEVREIPNISLTGNFEKTPHIGWADIEIPFEANDDRWQSSILHGLRPGTAMYFAHSFTAWPGVPEHRIADAFYGGHRIAAAVSKDNVHGTQFHPEKSGTAGLTLLRNFLEL